MGGASRWTSPLREQNPPWPPFGGPNHLRAVDRRPYIPPEALPPSNHPGGSRSHPAGRLTFSTPEIWFSLFMTDFSCAPSFTRISSRKMAN